MALGNGVGEPWQFVWLAAFGFVWGFFDSFAIGANDVANSFSTAVAAGTLSHRTAVGLALVAEFAGAMVLGSAVTDTVRKKVLDVDNFEHDPYVLMLGMCCAMVGSATWVLTATFLSMPVSSTHATIGAIMGVGFSAFGNRGIVWEFEKGGVLSILVSWITAPGFAGLASVCLYKAIHCSVLSHGDDESFRRGLATLPLYAVLTSGTICGFMIFKGTPALGLDKLSLSLCVCIVLGVCLLSGLFAHFIFAPWCHRVIRKGAQIPWFRMFCVMWMPPGSSDGEDGLELVSHPECSVGTRRDRTGQEGEDDASLAASPDVGLGQKAEPEDSALDVREEGLVSSTVGTRQRGWIGGMVDKMMVDITDETDCRQEALEQAATKFCPHTEELYKMLQVSTCVFASVSHGANDVANSVGPMATIWMVLSTGRVSSHAPVPWWILAYGAVALDVGLLTCGHHIMRAMGNRICYHSPSRGFCMDVVRRVGQSSRITSAAPTVLTCLVYTCIQMYRAPCSRS